MSRLSLEYLDATIQRVARLGMRNAQSRRRAATVNESSLLRAKGAITPRPCVVCGAAVVVGHHFDYHRPRLLIWLCARHHAVVHKLIRDPGLIRRAEKQQAAEQRDKALPWAAARINLSQYARAALLRVMDESGSSWGQVAAAMGYSENHLRALGRELQWGMEAVCRLSAAVDMDPLELLYPEYLKSLEGEEV